MRRFVRCRRFRVVAPLFRRRLLNGFTTRKVRAFGNQIAIVPMVGPYDTNQGENAREDGHEKAHSLVRTIKIECHDAENDSGSPAKKTK